MKILIIQENGRHEKNRIFRECFCLQRNLIKNGAETICWGLNHENFSQNFNELEKWCDVIFILENYTSQWLPFQDISKSKKIKFFWSIDSHCVLENHIEVCKKFKINILLNSTEEFIPFFKNVSDKQYWFPNAYDDSIIYPKNIEKKYNVGFCGNINNRITWVEHLSKFNLKKDIFVIGDDMVNAINSYKIHFNRNISNDINYRTFETTGCNTLLFTNYTRNIDKLFDLEKDIIIYNNFDDLDEKINFYLSNNKKREEVSVSGYMKSKNHHTYYQRTKEIIKIIKQF